MSRSNPPKKKRAQDLLAEHLREQIQTGQLKENDFLLPERKLAQEHGISSRAVREALATLEAEGLISRQQGRGTLVLGRERKSEDGALQNIAVIFLQRMRDASTIEFFDSLQQTFQRHGYGTTIYISNGDTNKETELVEQLAREGVPGIVLFSAHEAGSYAHLQAALNGGTKIVLFDHFFPGLPVNFVGIDDQLAAFEATLHLIRSGCRELMMLNSSVDWTTHTLRQKGFEGAVQKWGSPGAVPHVASIPVFKDVESYLEPLLSLLHRAREKVGILAWNDQIALEAIHFIERNGFSVPDDVAVVGFADDQEAALDRLALTTMQIPRESMGKLVAYTLMDQLRDPGCPPEHITVNARMVIRHSCGCYQSSSPSVISKPSVS